MINYAALAVSLADAIIRVLQAVEGGKLTLEQAQAKIAALTSGLDAQDAKHNAALAGRFPAGNTPGI